MTGPLTRFMTPIAEAIILHSLSVWECHVKFSSIYIPSDFTEETWSIVFVYQIEYLIF